MWAAFLPNHVKFGALFRFCVNACIFSLHCLSIMQLLSVYEIAHQMLDKLPHSFRASSHAPLEGTYGLQAADLPEHSGAERSNH